MQLIYLNLVFIEELLEECYTKVKGKSSGKYLYINIYFNLCQEFY